MKTNIYFSCSVLLFLSVFTNPCSASNKECAEKEKSLALLELAKDSITKAKELIPHCGEDISKNTSLLNNTTCGEKEKLEAYIDIALNLIDEAKENYPNCDFNKNQEPDEDEVTTTEEVEVTTEEDKVTTEKEVITVEATSPPPPLYADCLEVQRKGSTKSGVYTIRLNNIDARNKTLEVFCDMDTDGGGWTVIQRRGNFAPFEDFYRDWETYKNGFGNITRDFWLGNDNIYFLSNRKSMMVRFDLAHVYGERRYATYEKFSVEGQRNKYKLQISNYKGNAGDSMLLHDGQYFSTKDNVNDQSQLKNCPLYKRGGWWYNDCADCNPNGEYKPGVSDKKGAYWWYWNEYVGMDSIEIKLKPRY